MSSTRIVIVNYRTAGLVADSLRSLAPEVQANPGLRVTVVDGGSGDGSVEQLAEVIRAAGWIGWTDLLPLAENRGFSAANNAALRLLLAATVAPDYVLLLNPDTIVRPGAVRALVEFMEAHPKVGIAGSRLEDPDGAPQRSAFRFPSIASELEAGLRLGVVTKLLQSCIVAPPVRDDAHRTDWVSGASMIVRGQVFEAIGLMDEQFFLYYEETDFCLRAARAGWPSWYVPQSRVVHLVGQSTGMNKEVKCARRVPPYWFASRRRFLSKAYGEGVRLACDVVWALGFGLWRLRRRIQRKPDRDPPHMLRDFLVFTFRPASRLR